MPLAVPTVGGPQTAEVIKTVEKDTDAAMATYLVFDACRGDCNTAVVVTNDADLREPLRLIREELGLTIGVVNPHPPQYRSRDLPATFFKQLRPGVLADCQLPEHLTDSHGKIHRPADW